MSNMEQLDIIMTGVAVWINLKKRLGIGIIN